MIKGSTVCIIAMYVGWIGYVLAQGICYWRLHTFLPVEVTWGTVGLFLVETVSLARLRMAKEGMPIKDKIANPILKKLGVELPDFEDEAQEAAAKHAKGDVNGQTQES